MRVFVAGATGVLGRAALPLLLTAGHTVLGLARTPEKLLQVERTGASAIRGDMLDVVSIQRAVEKAQPEIILNLATAIPLRLRVSPKDWETNDRVRREGSANLLAAAKTAGVRLFVQESAGYLYASRGDAWLGENAPLSPHPFSQATRQMEELVHKADIPTVVLRFAVLTSADSWHTQQSIAALRRGMLPVIGDGAAYVSIIHAEDAAQAILHVIEKPAASAGQTFNIVDDEPAPMHAILPYAAQVLHAPAPRRVPPFMAKAVVGALTLEVLTASYRMSNAKIKQTLGFAPHYPTYRESWNQIAQAVAGRDFSPSDDLK